MLAARPFAPPDAVTDPLEIGEAFPERARRYGLARVSQAYGLTLLAAILALPVVGAGLITSNNCQLRGYACSDRLAYGLIGAIVLAVVTQLMLALHFRLGWSFWIGSALVMAGASLNTDHLPVLIGLVVLAPGVAAWFSEPPNRRRDVVTHWVPRCTALLALVLAAFGAGLLL
ncbi:hypothetical protein GCM10011575_43640 [Microlunatus endophyticus]|uniref:Uncharacterized protein n=1 Tax=Microlunatus endophyticus TaxID=1716077 RepID=A0A917SIH0_9ACTN|nr:hypothetical protein [Microlunatus endophyticus]GGL80611.1 hypothetical protein GCM10011575_43640 [Microlunatus endophyticus]